MKPLTKEQKAKLKRLEELEIIEEGKDIISNGREAVKLGFRLKLISSWRDKGRFYVLEIPKMKEQTIRTSEVGEFVVDLILKVKDPLNETLKEESVEELAEEEAHEDSPKSEPEKDLPEEATEKAELPLNYNDLTVAELKDLCREREISGFSTMSKAELVEVLEKDDSGELE